MVTFFLHIPLKQQLSNLLSGPIFHTLQRDRSNEFLSDVTSGSVYTKLRERGVISNNDILFNGMLMACKLLNRPKFLCVHYKLQ